MKTTKYFKEQVLRKRPYLKSQWCSDIIEKELNKIIQEDGRIRYWGYIQEENKYLRIVTLEDKTLHNAFFDRNFKEKSNNEV
ncbi:MAG: hypothetical protein A2Y25_09130 [Candidatus Melainabacteria bacterium GWF2_37_15]|nr:MAG: hypothetical protein A2Y25_09130 [Candidatus Melainabacteria bacterium GWF2_37_15]